MSDDTLDIEQPDALVEYLRQSGRIGRDEPTPRVTVLAGGVSNRTVLVERGAGEAWVLKQALAKLRVKVDWFSDPARIAREAQGLRHLAALAPAGAITPLVFEDPRHHLLAMRAVPPPHDNWKTLLLAGLVRAEHVRRFAELLGTVHRESWRRREELQIPQRFADRSFFESLRIEPYYQYSAAQVPDARPFLEALIDETRARRLALVHGDYSPKNILVYAGQLVLLDHEVIHWGDPAFDVGFSMAHLLSKGHHLLSHRRAFRDAASDYWTGYLGALGDVPWSASPQLADLDQRAGRHTLACLLARVAGRSTLEYLDDAERRRQRDVVVAMMCEPARPTVASILAFLERLD